MNIHWGIKKFLKLRTYCDKKEMYDTYPSHSWGTTSLNIHNYSTDPTTNASTSEVLLQYKTPTFAPFHFFYRCKTMTYEDKNLGKSLKSHWVWSAKYGGWGMVGICTRNCCTAKEVSTRCTVMVQDQTVSSMFLQISFAIYSTAHPVPCQNTDHVVIPAMAH